ncbi:MAG: hypothetical protein JW768_10295 [Chitinispirillaceae bacterium]|nr:hypothetical protein [Chitinispirillaceae bacterium]
MNDNHASGKGKEAFIPDEVDPDMRACIEAEIQEMEKYKWCMGVHLQRDPLNDRSLNDIYCEWIDKYASQFRKNWENRKREEAQNKG